MNGAPNTSLVEGITPAEDDKKVIAAITEAHRRSAVGSTEWAFGVRNAGGLIYRRGVVYGLVGFLHLAAILGDLGYHDELAKSRRTARGCDVIFRKGKGMGG